MVAATRNLHHCFTKVCPSFARCRLCCLLRRNERGDVRAVPLVRGLEDGLAQRAQALPEVDRPPRRAEPLRVGYNIRLSPQ